VVLAYGVAFACSAVPSMGVTSGFLGLESFAPATTELTVPRNLAVVDMEIDDPVALLDELGEVIELEPVVGTPWSRPVASLEPGSRVKVGHREALVVDLIDETPPSAPELTSARVHVFEYRDSGCGCTIVEPSCTGLETLYLTIAPAEDDYSARERITYALFAGSTSGEAAAATWPLRLLTGWGDDETELSMSWGLHDTDDVEWVAIAAVDQAGNMSARTMPVRLAR
jgi:hypothetical protein